MAWALVKTEPPFPHAPFDAFLRTLSPILQEKQSEVRASFGYDARHAASIFKRISLPDGAGVIDELIGFVGIKKSPEGKVMYKMEIVIGEKKLFHEISLSLPVTLGETLPTSLVEQLSKISLLGLMQKEGK
ncbi:MAG: hypothetical protein KGL59_09330 [Acidobacteriota bacterium]|nr:hypothetical protein [Acidobacteriota bacterium]